MTADEAAIVDLSARIAEAATAAMSRELVGLPPAVSPQSIRRLILHILATLFAAATVEALQNDPDPEKAGQYCVELAASIIELVPRLGPPQTGRTH